MVLEPAVLFLSATQYKGKAMNQMSDLQALVVAGETDWLKYGDVRTVRDGDLILFDYLQSAQYANNWNWFESVSRGLILNAVTGEVVARPFDKFFNWGERTTDAALVEATEKMDGSLGILYRVDGEYRISTRGSFVSEQALWATHELRKYDLSALPENLTLLFEIIYPENRIVVDYNGYSGLVLIGIRDRFTGMDYHYPALDTANELLGFKAPKFYPFDTIQEALALAQEIDANQEGWVLRFDDGSRFKVKGDQYKIAHKLMTGINFNRVLEATASGGLDAMLEGVPDELLVTIREYQQFIADTTTNILDDVASWMSQAPRGSRKEFALWVKANCPHMMPYMFAALDEHDLLPKIYKHAFKDVKFERDADISAEGLTDSPTINSAVNQILSAFDKRLNDEIFPPAGN